MISHLITGRVRANQEGKHMATWHAWAMLASLALDFSFFFFGLVIYAVTFSTVRGQLL